MSIALTEDHQSLAQVARDVLIKRAARADARALLEAEEEKLSDIWSEAISLGWLGLHIPEEHGGSGYGLEELVVVVEELGRELAPSPIVPTVIASAALAMAGDDEARSRWLPGLASGELIGAVALSADLTLDGSIVSGDAGGVVGAGHAQVIVAAVGDDVVVFETGAGVTVSGRKNLDPTRRAASVTVDGVDAVVLAGAAPVLTAAARTVLAAEAVGVAAGCTAASSEYAKERVQFGRQIGMFQAVKHHCSNMLVATEQAAALTWDAARASAGDVGSWNYAAAAAATIAARAAYQCANLNIQVHGGIGYTWEHDAHLFLRRAIALNALLAPSAASADVVAEIRSGNYREPTLELPEEAESFRDEVKAFAASLQGLEPDDLRRRLVDTGYLMPHWPAPWGRGASAVEQLVIEEEFKAAGIARDIDAITGYVSLTMVQAAAEEQIARWVPPALNGEFTWCQLFSEPDAGSDAAGIKTRGVRTDGGWLVTGQKLWTSGADRAKWGLVTVRTDPDAPKHQGITTMVVDMAAEGLDIRPLRQISGDAHFSEVFFNDVFIPDENVVGEVNGGWKVARTTLGNESVSVGSNPMLFTPTALLLDALDAHPERLSGGDNRLGQYDAGLQSLHLMNLRRVVRAVVNAGPGPEGAITKLVVVELGHEAAAILAELATPEVLFADGDGMIAAMLNLSHRVFSIGGGTSEIKRNQIGERLLGLPRDPLLN